MKKRNVVALGAFAALTAGGALVGAAIMRRDPEMSWYRNLERPPFTPPSWTFGVVWPLLYATIAYAGYRAWRRRDDPRAKVALGLWGAQLALNAAWTPLFFGAHRGQSALVVIVLTVASTVGFMASIARIDRRAAVVMAPSVAWLGFATALNASIVGMNSEALRG